MVFLTNAVNALGHDVGTAGCHGLVPTVWHFLAIHWASWGAESQELPSSFLEGVNISQEEPELHCLNEWKSRSRPLWLLYKYFTPVDCIHISGVKNSVTPKTSCTNVVWNLLVSGNKEKQCQKQSEKWWTHNIWVKLIWPVCRDVKRCLKVGIQGGIWLRHWACVFNLPKLFKRHPSHE